MSEKPQTKRSTPPEDDEWSYFWDSLDKSQKMWIIVGPIVAIVTNWRALTVAGAVIAWIKSDQILLLLREAAGLPL